jgi:hypothetical protein
MASSKTIISRLAPLGPANGTIYVLVFALATLSIIGAAMASVPWRLAILGMILVIFLVVCIDLVLIRYDDAIVRNFLLK